MLKNTTWFYEYCCLEKNLNHTLVILSGKDSMVDSYVVEKYLLDNTPIVVWQYPNKRHGETIYSKLFHARLIKYIETINQLLEK